MITGICPPPDDVQIRCPRLGHQVAFSYCVHENSGLPCHKSLDCWHRYFSVSEFLKHRLSKEEWDRIFSLAPQPKMVSIAELIERAKKVKT